MWLCRVKQALHDFLNVRRYAPILGMVDPVSGRIWGEREVFHGISVDFVIKLEEDTEAGMCNDGMRRFEEDVIIRKTLFSSRESL